MITMVEGAPADRLRFESTDFIIITAANKPSVAFWYVLTTAAALVHLFKSSF